MIVTPRLAWSLALLATVGCRAGEPVMIASPLDRGAVMVRIAGQPSAGGGASQPGPGGWINECESIPRLGSSEPRGTWIDRIENYVRERADRLASISYPPGDGVEIALVCFSTAGWQGVDRLPRAP